MSIWPVRSEGDGYIRKIVDAYMSVRSRVFCLSATTDELVEPPFMTVLWIFHDVGILGNVTEILSLRQLFTRVVADICALQKTTNAESTPPRTRTRSSCAGPEDSRS